ncbi:MAG: SseB family protein [Eubacterium sp.]|nr:SseB family protein [Eubacterium sp.]
MQLFRLDDTDSKPEPYRVVNVDIEDGSVKLKSEESASENSFEVKLGEQMSNEFLIQTERLEIRKWNPMYYSPAYAGEYKCSWVLDYSGLNGESTMRSGVGTYPKKWQMLMDLIDSLNDRKKLLQENAGIASEYAGQMISGKPGSAEAAAVSGVLDTVNILSAMQMPQDVIAAGILRSIFKAGFDADADPAAGPDSTGAAGFARENFDKTVSDMLALFGDETGMEPAVRRVALIEKVKSSDSLYFKRLVLAETLSDLVSVKAKMDMGKGFDDPAMEKGEMGIYYAQMISALEILGGDKKAGAMYQKLIDLYKTVFVSYYLDSVNGVIYQTQGGAAGVALKRGEYDWYAMDGDIPPEAEFIRKDLALFLAGLWRREADETLVKDGNKAGVYDVPDITVMKVVMGKAASEKDHKDNEVVLSVLRRMISEDEQILTPMRAEEPDMELIENGEIEDVNSIPVSFLGLEADDGKTMAAVFTSLEELGEIDGADVEAIPVRMIFEFVRHMKRLDGIMIDPFSDRFTISKDKIAEILDDLKKDSKPTA